MTILETFLAPMKERDPYECPKCGFLALIWVCEGAYCRHCGHQIITRTALGEE